MPGAGGIASQAVLGAVMLESAGGIRTPENRALAEAAAGRPRPAVQRVAPADAAVAHRRPETRATMGKVVLMPGQGRTTTQRSTRAVAMATKAAPPAQAAGVPPV
ncbi:hypothetical protein [Streptomyces sp. NBC_01497]|uniref:hypothetical protein n=1 Tax=Streptomyces sp. NBC_01497 TaxID=2903885 RepID=UPI003FCD0344